MPTLPAVIVTLLLPFEHLFDPRTWRKAQLLAMGAILSPGKRTVSSHEQKSQLEPQANRLWAHAGQNGSSWTKWYPRWPAVSMIAARSCAGCWPIPKWARSWSSTGTGWRGSVWAWWMPCCRLGAGDC